MDLSDLSLGSSEDEENPKDNSSGIEKLKLDNTDDHFSTGIEKKSNKNDQCQDKYESVDSVAVSRASTPKVQGESPTGAKGKRSLKISPGIDIENFKHSQSRLSLASTNATFGSSSSNSVSSDDEPLDDLKEVSESYEPENTSDLEHEISEPPSTNIENVSDSVSVMSSAGHTELIKESQISKCVSTGADGSSSLPEYSPSLKIHQSHADDLSSTAMERSPNNSETDGMQFSRTHSSDESSKTEKLSSSMNLAAVSPMPSNTEKDDEMSDCGSTGSFDDDDFDQQKYKSGRRNIKAADTDLPSNELPLTLINLSRSIGHSLKHVCDRMENTLNTDNDRDLHETERSSTSMNPNTVPPMPRNFSSSNTEEYDEMSDCGCAGSFDDDDFDQQKYKSDRRNIKAADTNLPSTELPLTLINLSRSIGHSLKQVCDRMENTLNTDNDRDLHETERSSSSMNPNTVPSMSRESSSSNVGGDEMPLALSDYGAMGGFDDNDQQKDKSVRRKIKAETLVVSDTNLPPTELPSASVSKHSRRIGHSLLQMSKKMEKTSNEDEDWDFCESYCRKAAESFESEASMEEIKQFFYPTQNSNNSPRLDTESLLKEVNLFFRHNRVETDANRTWREMEDDIFASPYFSDDFAQEHGLLTFEELGIKFKKDFEYYSTSYLKNLIKLQELCKRLMDCNISERNLIDYCADPLSIIPESGSFDRSRRGSSLAVDAKRQLCSIAEEIGWDIMIDLCKKVAAKGKSFSDILCYAERSTASVAEEIHRIAAKSSPLQSSSLDTIFTGYGTHLREISENFESSRRGGNVTNLGESTGESSTNHPRESPIVISESDADSRAMAMGESSYENRTKSTSEATEKSKASCEENASKDGSNVSTENFESKIDKTDDEE